MPDLSSRGIFLSYRREEAAVYARLLKTEFSERIPDTRVFMDLDSIKAGRDFAEVIQEALDSSAVLVVVIGRQWTTLTDEEGRRKLDNPDDWVRFEVQAALERDVGVLPVLVDGARPLRQQQLPTELHKLARLNAFELSLSRYRYDADRLVDLVREVLAEASGIDTAHQSAPGASADDRPDENAPGYEAPEKPRAAREDPDRTGHVLNDAERIARSITDTSSQARALASIAQVPDEAPETDMVHQPAPEANAGDRPDENALDYLAPEESGAAWEDLYRTGRVLNDAERIARSITDKSSQARALASIARVLAATDPDRAARLGTDAERIAPFVTTEFVKANVLADIAGALAATDPDRAEHSALAITDESSRARALASIARVLAATDPDRAARLITAAEHVGQDITDQSSRARALASIARVLAATDADHAALIARTIPDKDRKAGTLAYIARVLAATDPDRARRLRTDAERLAYRRGLIRWFFPTYRLFHTYLEPDVRADLVGALAATGGQDDAEIMALHSADATRPLALVAVAEALAATDPDHVERFARENITSKLSQVQVLLTIAEASSAEV